MTVWPSLVHPSIATWWSQSTLQPRTPDSSHPPASASLELELQACTTAPGSSVTSLQFPLPAVLSFQLWLPLTVAITVPPSTVTPTAEMQISGSYVVLSTFSLWLLGGPEKSKNSHWKTRHLPASTWMSECKRKKKSPSLGIFILDYFTVTFTSCPEQQIQWVHDRKKN